jgi:hypothetical protein
MRRGGSVPRNPEIWQTAPSLLHHPRRLWMGKEPHLTVTGHIGTRGSKGLVDSSPQERLRLLRLIVLRPAVADREAYLAVPPNPPANRFERAIPRFLGQSDPNICRLGGSKMEGVSEVL